jgi:hypothetical protein
VCLDSLWPYNGIPVEGNVTHAGPGVPAQEVRDGAKSYRHLAAQYGARGSAAQLLSWLTQNQRPVAISVPIFRDALVPDRNNWNSDVGILYGEVLDPPATAVADGGHAVCVVGFVPDPEENTGGNFIFRNSWGTSGFGRNLPSSGWRAQEPGYGQISASYIDKYLWEMCVL